jgi:tRNA-specific 2-thiouridylase
LCNREIKFKDFKQKALELGADYIATGHYCDILHDGDMHYLLKAKDQSKDQTYFLNQLSQQQLDKVLFPLGKLDKSEVRRIAEQNGLATATKKDSTGICFIGERNFRNFLQTYIPNKKGKIMTYDGKVLGEHLGLMYYTIGQRRGLGIGGQAGDDGSRWFVIEKDLKNNILYVAHGSEDKLYSKGLIMNSCNWIPRIPDKKDFECTAKFRYRQPEQKCTVHIKDSHIEVEFFERQRAITEGQFAVFYDGDKCIGGGVIEKAVF